jgi:hypothetical protein
VSFAAITLCVASYRVFVVVSVYFFIDSVRKLLDTPSCASSQPCTLKCSVVYQSNDTYMAGLLRNGLTLLLF